MTHRFIEERKKNVCRTPKWQITTLHVRSVKSSHSFQKRSLEEFAIHNFCYRLPLLLLFGIHFHQGKTRKN